MYVYCPFYITQMTKNGDADFVSRMMSQLKNKKKSDDNPKIKKTQMTKNKNGDADFVSRMMSQLKNRDNKLKVKTKLEVKTTGKFFLFFGLSSELPTQKSRQQTKGKNKN